MPPVWGAKYLRELGLESWEQLDKIYEERLQQEIRHWDAEMAHKSNQKANQEDKTERHAPPRKARAQQEHHQAPAPASHGSPPSPRDEQDSDDKSVHSVDELPNAVDPEFLDDEDDESEPGGSETSSTSDSEDIPLFDLADSDTSSAEATP
ncbi:hypothetical protein ACHAPT_000793 [Fusarium lateritium]